MSQEKETQVIEEGVVEETAIETAPEENIFNDIFGDNSDEFVAKVQEESLDMIESNPAEIQSPSDPKEDSSQFQYWQSQADKKQAELNAMKEKLDAIEAKVNSPAQSTAEPEPKETGPVKPVKPTKPSNFDHSEALTDADSPSAKYMAARDAYVEDMTEYIANIEQKRNEDVEKYQAQQRKVAQQQQLVRDLQANYGYTPDQSQDFLQKMSSPESLSLDNLVKLHQLDLGKSQQQVISTSPPDAQRKQQVMSERNQKLSIPKPISTQPSVNMQSSKKSAEDQMMDSMLSDYKKRNPFQ